MQMYMFVQRRVFFYQRLNKSSLEINATVGFALSALSAVDACGPSWLLLPRGIESGAVKGRFSPRPEKEGLPLVGYR